MIDPITIFAACKAAHAGIRECIDLYQDFKKDGKDVGDIVNDIGGHLGAFFTHQESFKEAENRQNYSHPKTYPSIKKRWTEYCASSSWSKWRRS